MYVTSGTYSTNAIESLHARMRRATRARGACPNEQAALKCLYKGDDPADLGVVGHERREIRSEAAFTASLHHCMSWV
jgi:putative transposase